MDFVDTYSEVTAKVDDISTLEHLETFVHEILRAYDLKHAVYYMPGLPGQEEVKPVSIITYPPEWVRRYFEADFLPVDPCVSEGFANLLPLDWMNYDKRPPRVKQLFGESTEFGIGRQGMTFPIRGPKGEGALFNITSDLSDNDWLQAKKTYTRDFRSWRIPFMPRPWSLAAPRSRIIRRD